MGGRQMRAKYNDTYYEDAMMKYITLYSNLLFFSLAEEEQTLWKLLAYKIERSIANGKHKAQADAPNKYRHIGQRQVQALL